jgi:flagellar basal-body rod modification protein FlgD
MTFAVDGSAATYSMHSASSATPRAKEDNGQLGRDDFLQLLVAQLRYQDPTSPMDTSQFMAQTTQLASVERLTELSTMSRQSFDLQISLAASSMVGKHITYSTGDSETASGVVDGVALDGPVPMLKIGDQRVALDQIVSIAAPPAAAPAAPAAPPAQTEIPNDDPVVA